MPVRKSHAVWNGNLVDGNGKVVVGNGSYEGAYSFSSRFEEGEGTNPEELIGAAHAGCYSMELAHELHQAKFSPQRIETQANVHLIKSEKGFDISEIELITKAKVSGISEKDFKDIAKSAKKNCPVSRALTGVKINLQATLVQ